MGAEMVRQEEVGMVRGLELWCRRDVPPRRVEEPVVVVVIAVIAVIVVVGSAVVFVVVVVVPDFVEQEYRPRQAPQAGAVYARRFSVGEPKAVPLGLQHPALSAM